jgi:hypothetical protein
MLRLQIFLMMLLYFILQNGHGLPEQVSRDESLVAPGIGAERIVISRTLAQFESVYSGESFKNVFTKVSAEIFRDVLKVKCNHALYFNEIRYYSKNQTAFFLLNNRVQAIAGRSDNRVTSDSIDLEKGVEYFVYSYGNKSLERIRDGKSSIYLYPGEGIAVIDDDDDDDIDMYLIFPAIRKDAH